MSINIDNAFTSAILAGGLALDVVHDNGIYSYWNGSAYVSVQGVYTPDANRAYCEIKVFPASTTPLTLSSYDDSRGIYQAIVHYPADTGSIAAKTKAESILALFKPGATLTSGSQAVNIMNKTRDGGRVEGGFYQIVIRVEYRAYTAR